MAQRIYRTALGQELNIEQMRILGETAVTVGNMPVNARGDEILPNGEIIKPRNQIMKERYKSAGSVTKYNPNKRRPMEEIPQIIQVEPPVTPTPNQQNTDLRGSLASSVSFDLTQEAPKQTRTLRRI
jgi:hypothetical protein